MGRKAAASVRKFFKELPCRKGIKIKQFICKFCNWRTSLNATRMKHHIIRCSKVPKSVKELLVSGRPNPTLMPDPGTSEVTIDNDEQEQDDPEPNATLYASSWPRPKSSMSHKSTSSHSVLEHSTPYTPRSALSGLSRNSSYKSSYLMDSFVDKINDDEKVTANLITMY